MAAPAIARDLAMVLMVVDHASMAFDGTHFSQDAIARSTRHAGGVAT